MEEVAYGGWPSCVRLSNGVVDLVATTDVGPRIIRFGFVGRRNVLKEYPDQMGTSGGREWRIYGGHRLWHAPEAQPRTYEPDNQPVASSWNDQTLTVVQPREETTGLQKSMRIRLEAEGARVRIVHRLVNLGPWEVRAAPWALTVMAPGGRAIFPQEPYRPHPDFLLPARPLVLWHYTDMSDPRWSWGERYIQLRQDPGAQTKQKVGMLNNQGWMAYTLDGALFLKRFAVAEGAVYPDMGCNTETFTDADMLELESLGPLTAIGPDGGEVEHTEEWSLFEAEIGDDEPSIHQTIEPLVRQTQG
jgi:hypothetical protein